ALAAGLGLSGLALLPVRAGLRRVLPFAGCGIVLLYGVVTAPWYYLQGTPEQKARRLYGPETFPESPVVGRFLAGRSTPEDTVFILGSEPQILYYAERKSASRFIFVYPLMFPTPATERYCQEVIDELRRNGPAFIITVFFPPGSLGFWSPQV